MPLGREVAEALESIGVKWPRPSFRGRERSRGTGILAFRCVLEILQAVALQGCPIDFDKRHWWSGVGPGSGHISSAAYQRTKSLVDLALIGIRIPPGRFCCEEPKDVPVKFHVGARSCFDSPRRKVFLMTFKETAPAAHMRAGPKHLLWVDTG